ncbi:MAG TPA: hypothetical protein VJ583_04805 [Nitrososphaeraceae archaeon]|nr:hypothetical protein [Nitrososphaeraceae archaeon]
MMKQIYLIIALLTTLTIGISSINSAGITLAQEKNETLSEIDDSPLITTEQIDESMETNNTSSQANNNIPLIE